MLQRQKRLNFLPETNSTFTTKCNYCSFFRYFFRILFAAFSDYRRISVRFSLEIFVIIQHCLHQNVSLKIVLIKWLGGATVPYPAYTAFRRISVRFRRCLRMHRTKHHVLYSDPLELSQLVVTLDSIFTRKFKSFLPF